jgi:hypothetical protein
MQNTFKFCLEPYIVENRLAQMNPVNSSIVLDKPLPEISEELFKSLGTRLHLQATQLIGIDQFGSEGRRKNFRNSRFPGS